MHMIQTISIYAINKQFNMTNEYNLISEYKTSDKSKNPAPDYDERTAYLRIRRLEMSRKFLLDRADTYWTRIEFDLGLVRFKRHVLFLIFA